MKTQVRCAWCGKEFSRYPSQLKKYNFCSRECLGHFASKADNPDGYTYRDFSKNSKRLTELNKQLNPNRMTMQTRTKLRECRLGNGEGKTYAKLFGRPEHRVVAEQMLARPLRRGEVVHHKDRNKRNNSPENLLVFPSQAAHAQYHKEHDDEEVMPL